MAFSEGWYKVEAFLGEKTSTVQVFVGWLVGPSSRMTVVVRAYHRPSHPYNVGTERVCVSPTKGEISCAKRVVRTRNTQLRRF